jgi:hypothetical protein
VRRSVIVQAAWEPRFAEKSGLFWPVARAASAFAGREGWPTVDEIAGALRGLAGIDFVVQPPRSRRRRVPVDPAARYDAQIVLGRVPTRERNWHDLLNALVWATFPKAKHALHARQHRAISAQLDPGVSRLPGARTREQDALAMLDEGGVVLVRGAGVEVTPIVFGHALYERLVLEGPRAVAATCEIVVPSEEGEPADVERRLARVDEQLALRLGADWPARPEDLGHVTLEELEANRSPSG